MFTFRQRNVGGRFYSRCIHCLVYLAYLGGIDERELDEHRERRGECVFSLCSVQMFIHFRHAFKTESKQKKRRQCSEMKDRRDEIRLMRDEKQ